MTKANPKLYLLIDGTYADPKDCSKDKDGKLAAKNGVAVALGEDGGPMTLGEATATNAQAAAATDGDADLVTTEDVKTP